MERHYTVLRKKLVELESLLQGLLSHPSQEPSFEQPCHQLDHQEIQARLGFLKILLSSEMEINTQSMPDKLQEIASGLATLEEAYHKWMSSMASPDGRHDTLSSCSCTSSCLDDVENEDLVLADEDILPSHRSEEYIAELPAEEDVDEALEGDEKGAPLRDLEALETGYSLPLASPKYVEVRRSSVTRQGKEGEQKLPQDSVSNCGTMGTLVLVGAVAAMVATNFWPVEEVVYLLPT